MNLPALAFRYRAVVITAAAILTAWGVAAFFTMPRREDPSFTIRTCTITTRWPGATALKVEQLVTDPIEKEVDSLDEVERVWSTTTVGLSTIYVELEDTVNDVDSVWHKVRARVDEVGPQLPDGAGEPSVNDDFGDTAALLLAVYQKRPEEGQTGRTYTSRELEIIATRLKDDLKLIPSVADVELFGVRQEAIYLEIDASRWSQLSITVAQLQDLLSARNIIAPGGSVDTPHSRFGVNPSGELTAVDQLNRVVAEVDENAAPVYLKDLDIGVHRRYEEPPRVLTRYAGPDQAGAEALLLAITMKDGRRINDLGAAVRDRLRRARDGFVPRDIAVAVVSDQPTSVERRIDEFVVNLGQAVFIVVLVAFLLIGLRVAVVMAAAVPLVLIPSVGLSRLFGVELEQMSIASLIISLGLLVDCAIEVCDNVHRLLEEGYDRARAAVEGARQIAFPVLIATLTTVAGFAPMLVALQGPRREYGAAQK